MNFQESKVLVLSLPAQTGTFFHFQNLLWVFLRVPTGMNFAWKVLIPQGFIAGFGLTCCCQVFCIYTHVSAENPGSTEIAVSQIPTLKSHFCKGQWRGLWKCLPCMPPELLVSDLQWQTMGRRREWLLPKLHTITVMERPKETSFCPELHQVPHENTWRSDCSPRTFHLTHPLPAPRARCILKASSLLPEHRLSAFLGVYHQPNSTQSVTKWRSLWISVRLLVP